MTFIDGIEPYSFVAGLSLGASIVILGLGAFIRWGME